MPKRTELPSEKKTIPVYQEDWEFLLERYGPGGLHSVGVGPLIREIIHRKVRELRAREHQRLDQQKQPAAQVREEGLE